MIVQHRREIDTPRHDERRDDVPFDQMDDDAEPDDHQRVATGADTVPFRPAQDE